MIRTDRPKLKIPITPADILIECVSIGLIIYIWIHLFLVFGELPDRVPSHFNAAGEADGFSSKTFLFFLPALSTLMYIGLFWLTKFPHLHNYMVNITEENAFKQYRFGVTVLRIVNLLCVIMFAYINYHMLTGAGTSSADLGKGFLFVVIGVSILLPVVIIYYQNKIK